jgi:hypothetical protein
VLYLLALTVSFHGRGTSKVIAVESGWLRSVVITLFCLALVGCVSGPVNGISVDVIGQQTYFG